MRNFRDVGMIHVDVQVTRSARGDIDVTYVDYWKHGSVVRNLVGDDVMHVDLRKTCFSREQPWGRRRNTRVLHET